MLASAWLAGASPWWLAVWGASARNGFAAGLSEGLFGHAYSGQVLGLRSFFGPFWLPNMAIFALNFLSPLWWVAAWGCMAGARRHALKNNAAFIALAALFAVHFLFFIRYPVADQATFAIPTVALLAVAGGAGVSWLTARWRGRAKAALMVLGMAAPVVLYALAGLGLGEMYARGVIPRKARELPFREEIRYWTLPWKAGERSAELFAEEVFRQFDDKERHGDSVLLADATVAETLRVTLDAKRRGMGAFSNYRAAMSTESRPPPRIDDARDGTPEQRLEKWLPLAREGRLYVVSPQPGYAPAEVLGRMDFVKDGVVHRAILKTETQ